ncbi:MAG: helix-turn-helix transcriptional regulator [Burkholderiales bacterium]|nr:helix-turn-helix transcriptional regulator [Burkholderiales bacterium]
MILGAAFSGIERFSDWRRQIGIASNILARRLDHLVQIDCLEKATPGAGGRATYRLTAKGRDLYPVVLMFRRFDRAWSPGRSTRPGAHLHAACGGVANPELVCGHCRAPVRAHDVAYVEGPGARLERMPPPMPSRRSSGAAEGASSSAGPFGASVDVFGDRWTQLILGTFFLGGRRFEDIRARWHVATNVLSDRLKMLVAHGFLQKRVYQENPERSEYVLTPKAMDVYPILVTLNQWGDRWLATDGKAPLTLFHRSCGRTLAPVVVCSHCAAPLRGDDIDTHGTRDGPVATPAP